MSGRRTLAAWLPLVLGAGALVTSAFSPWQDGVSGLDLRVGYLWQSAGPAASSSVGSVGAALIVLAASALLGGVLRFRFLTAMSGLIALVVPTMYVVHEAMLVEPAEFTAADVLSGPWAAAAGGLLILAAALVPLRREPDRVPISRLS